MHRKPEFSRRKFIHTLGLGATGAALAPNFTRLMAARATWHVPAEEVLHIRCWMAWPSSLAIWGSRLLPKIQADIATVAKTIAKYEPVTMCADGADADAAAQAACGPTVTVISSIPVNDCWMRDSGPIFRVNDEGGRNAVGLNFNGWGNKQISNKDKFVAQKVAANVGVRLQAATFVSEGGAIECDGDGTLIATESSIINPNRNPGKSKAQLEAAMRSAYGAQKVLWVPGLVGQDITDDHIDATSRFVRPGVVLVQLAPPYRHDIWAQDALDQYQILSASTDAKGRPLQVVTIEGPDTTRVQSPDFLDSYVNYYPANGAIITAQFGDIVKDAAAKATLESLFPRRVVEQLNVDNLHSGGGGVHCVTQQEPVA